jgi:hypothetical protein
MTNSKYVLRFIIRFIKPVVYFKFVKKQEFDKVKKNVLQQMIDYHGNEFN